MARCHNYIGHKRSTARCHCVAVRCVVCIGCMRCMRFIGLRALRAACDALRWGALCWGAMRCVGVRFVGMRCVAVWGALCWGVMRCVGVALRVISLIHVLRGRRAPGTQWLGSDRPSIFDGPLMLWVMARDFVAGYSAPTARLFWTPRALPQERAGRIRPPHHSLMRLGMCVDMCVGMRTDICQTCCRVP